MWPQLHTHCSIKILCRQHSPCHDSHLPKIPQHRNPTHWLAETVKVSVSCAFKKGDRNLAENYRPISLTSVSCKVLEHVIYRHLMTHFQYYRILTPKSQISVRLLLWHTTINNYTWPPDVLRCWETSQHSHSQLSKAFDKVPHKKLFHKLDHYWKQVDIVIINFSEAFDKEPHKKLHKLDHYGIRGPLHTWLTTFLTQWSMKVVLEGKYYDDVPVEPGVPQGTVLGPILSLSHQWPSLLYDIPGLALCQLLSCLQINH